MQSIERTNWIWSICVLVLIIIILLAVKWSDIKDLAGILNFALGLTSLVLAMVAIVYGFIANNSLTGTVSKIESAASEVTTMVKIIPEKLLVIERTTQDINKAIASQPSIPNTPPRQAPENNEAITQFADTVVTQFLNVSSWNGIKLMRVCKFSQQHNVRFNLGQLCGIDNTMTPDYAFGFLVAAASASFFQLNQNDGSFLITNMPPMVLNKIDAAILDRINNTAHPLPLRTDFSQQLVRLDNYLNSLLHPPVVAPQVPQIHVEAPAAAAPTALTANSHG